MLGDDHNHARLTDFKVFNLGRSIQSPEVFSQAVLRHLEDVSVITKDSEV